MKTVAFIPIKSFSERIKHKNFLPFRGRKLYEHIILKAISSNRFDDIYVDTDSTEIKNYCKGKVSIINRLDVLVSDSANGNDLLNYHRELHSNYDIYFQLFVTAPYLQIQTIQNCVDELSNTTAHDSIFTASMEPGWFWFNDQPVNYRPSVLPRSQDAQHLIKETTGLYGIVADSLDKYRARIGSNPIKYIVEDFEAVDLDTLNDFEKANKSNCLCETEPDNPYIYDDE